jgi:hypothetical protein
MVLLWYPHQMMAAALHHYSLSSNGAGHEAKLGSNLVGLLITLEDIDLQALHVHLIPQACPYKHRDVQLMLNNSSCDESFLVADNTRKANKSYSTLIFGLA